MLPYSAGTDAVDVFFRAANLAHLRRPFRRPERIKVSTDANYARVLQAIRHLREFSPAESAGSPVSRWTMKWTMRR